MALCKADKDVSETLVVTGGAGFIGSHVADRLVSDGASVVVIDDLSSGDPTRVPNGAALETIDITDIPALDRLIDTCRPSGIFHLAAQSSVTVSVQDPRRDNAVNVQGTLNILEASKRHGAPVVLTSTGGALYGNSAPIPTPETQSPAPLAPYGASKWAAEAYLNTWSAATGIPHSVCRLGNVYGPRQSPYGEAGVVAIIGHQLSQGRRPVLFGHGRPTRDYVHVFDVVTALRGAMGRRGTFNIATGVETSVATIYEILQRAAGRRIVPELLPLREGELERSCMDPGRALRSLGWRAEIAVERGVEETFHSLVDEFERSEQTSY